MIIMTYSIDFRKKLLAMKEKEELSFESISKRFGVGKNSVFVWSKKISPLKNRNRASTKYRLINCEKTWCNIVTISI